jgi:peptide/nickel transport system substrate-binding protein
MPWRYESPRGPWFFASTHESLIGADADTGEHVPQLAESWSIEPDGISVRFKLREGVQFHGDNGDFSAADVAATLKNHGEEDSRHTHRSQYRAVDLEIVSPHEIVYNISKSNPEILNNSSSWNVISGEPFSAKDLEKLGGDPDLTSRPPAGTGAFQFKERTQGVNFIVERVPYKHWRYNSDWEEIEFRFQGEASTRLAALLTSEVHVTTLPLDLQNQAESNGMATATGQVMTRERTALFQGPLIDKKYGSYEVQNTPCGYNFCDDPFLDIRVRKALSKAVDRAAINTAFFGGKGVPVHNHAFVPTRSYWNPDWDRRFQEEYGYDPAAARTLLAEAGYNPSNPLEILVDGTGSSGLPEKQDVMESIAGFFTDVGVKVKLDSRDATVIRAIQRGFGHTGRIVYQTSNIVDIQTFRVHHCSCESPRGGALELKEMDEAIAFHRAIIDTKEVYKRLRTTGDVTFDLHIAIPLVWKPEELSYNPNVVASYKWSGVPLGTVSHFERFLAVKE